MTTYGIIGIKTWIYSGETEEEQHKRKRLIRDVATKKNKIS